MAPPSARLDGSAGLCDDVLDDREAEPGPARRARPVRAVEALEEPRELCLLDADPVVSTGQDDLACRRSRSTASVNVAPGPA